MDMESQGSRLAPTASAALSEEPVTQYGWKALAGSVIGFSMDGFDMLILGFMLPAISAGLALTGAQAGSLVTWTLLGAVTGGIIFGTVSDHFGRIKVLTWTIVIFAVFTGLCGLAQGYWDLVAYRTFAGVGLGGEFGIGMALAAESWPDSKRARASSYVGLGWQAGVCTRRLLRERRRDAGGWQAGVLLAAFVTPVLLPLIGWRGMFLVGLAPALVAFVVRRTLHEPEIFVRRHASRSENSFRSLVKDTKTFKITLAIAILCAIQNFGYYGIMIWMPTYLSKILGFNLMKSGVWTAVTVLGMACGVFVCGQLADRIGRKPVFILFQAGALIMVLFYSRITEPNTLLLVGGVMGMFVNGAFGCIGALMSEAYPTRARATAQNVLFNIGRGIGSLGPLTVGVLAARYSFQAAIALLASIYLVDIIVTLFLVPELVGKPLE